MKDHTSPGIACAATAAPRILHAIPSIALRHGGPSQSVAGLLGAQNRIAPGRIALICGQDPAEPDLNVSRRWVARYLSQRFWCPAPSALPVMRGAIGDADIVHVHSYWNGFAATMIALAQRAGKPVVLSPRGCLQHAAIAQSSARAKAVFARLGGHRQLARLSGCHFQTEAEAHASLGVGDRPRVIVDNGVALPRPEPSHTALRARVFADTPDAVNLLFLGRIAAIKGIDLQLRALQHLRNRGVPAILHLVGPDGGDLNRLRALAGDLGLADRLKVHGPVYGDGKFDWMRAADAVLLTSEFENNSNAALEVMAAGGVLVATSGCIANRAVAAGAATCVARDAGALVDALARTGTDGQRSAARAYVRNNHNWSDRASRMLAFYETLL